MGVKWLGLEVLRLEAGESWQGQLKDEEAALVLLSGRCSVSVDQTRFDFSIETFDRALLDSCVSEANRLLAEQRQVMEAAGYKAEYNEELLAMVKGRRGRLARGELSVEDYTLKGSLPLLHALRAAGVRLYLASGTDQQDVAAEAAALGFAELFTGGIRGSIGDVRVEAKKVVLEGILAEIGPEGRGGLVTFGDGPVEMRETKRKGAYAVGVASDEPRRYGWNMRKRTRLIRAGADLVVPDFTQWKSLLGLFGIRA
jgi:phosphoglycolate phosphatase-like HAD superfamily hydrolase